ncbi:MAG: helix-turn-helix transcriptional regulator [Mangrovibacterium sp.]
MTEKEKIKQYLAFKGIRKTNFYAETSLSNGFLESGKSLGADKIKIIISKYPDLNLNWLIFDEGEMLKNKEEGYIANKNFFAETKNIKNETYQRRDQSEECEVYSEPETNLQKCRLITDGTIVKQEIPLYNLETCSGLVSLFRDPAKQKPVNHIRIPGLTKCDGAISVSGDNMYPLLQAGDMVLYKQISDIGGGIFWGEMYLLSIDLDGNEYIIIRYIQKSEKSEFIKLVSYNRAYSDQDIPIEKVNALALIKAWVRISSMK